MNTQISWKNKLQELCHSRRLEAPVYTSFNVNTTDGLKWGSSVEVDGISSNGGLFDRKVDSEQAAAEQLYNLFIEFDEPGEDDLVSSVIYDGIDWVLQRRATERDTLLPSPRESIHRTRSRESIHRTRSRITTPVHNHSATGPAPVHNHSATGPVPVHSEPASISLLRELHFPNSIFDEQFLSHLTYLVRNKNVEICNISDYVSNDSPVVIYLIPNIQTINSTTNYRSVRVEVPLLQNRESFQAMIFLSICMELGADSCSIIGMPGGNVNRVVINE
jgi:hypothetical protein